MENAERLLRDGGRFYVILPTTEIAEFQYEAEKHFALCETIAIRPTPKKAVSRHILGFSHRAGSVRQSELTIRDEENRFSEAYRTLTREFYLDF